MDKMQKMMELFQDGNNCCRIITYFLAEPCGFNWEEEKEELSVMCATCGGTCSSLRGGTYGIHSYAERKGYSHEKAREMSEQLFDRFHDKHGAILCKDLFTGDMMECSKYVSSVIDLTEELIAAEQQTENSTNG